MDWLIATVTRVRHLNQTAKSRWCAIAVPDGLFDQVAACGWLADLCRVDAVILLRLPQRYADL